MANRLPAITRPYAAAPTDAADGNHYNAPPSGEHHHHLGAYQPAPAYAAGTPGYARAYAPVAGAYGGDHHGTFSDRPIATAGLPGGPASELHGFPYVSHSPLALPRAPKPAN